VADRRTASRSSASARGDCGRTRAELVVCASEATADATIKNITIAIVIAI
jgi:hypothetical protein